MMYARRKFNPKDPNMNGYGFGGISAAIGVAGAVTAYGAAITVAGSALGIKEAAPVGNLMMAGGSIASGVGAMQGLSAAGGMGMNLATLSAGSSLVGGALQGVGALIGNNKMSAIGGLMGAAGQFGTAMNTPVADGNSSAFQSTTTDANGTMAIKGTPNTLPNQTPDFNSTVNANPTSSGGSGGAAAGGGTKATVGGLEGFMNKYDKLISMAGKAADTMNANKVANDKLAQDQAQFNATRAFAQQQHPNGSYMGTIPVSAPATPVAVQPIDPNYYQNKLSIAPKPAGLIAAGTAP